MCNIIDNKGSIDINVIGNGNDNGDLTNSLTVMVTMLLAMLLITVFVYCLKLIQ